MKLSDLEKEIVFQTSRSGGSGGQHVNKVETKVELSFDVSASVALTDDEKNTIFQKLKSRINEEGLLKLSVDKERSQLRNKKLAIAAFKEIVTKSLIKKKPRVPTRPSKTAKEKRLKEKKMLSEKKQRRKDI